VKRRLALNTASNVGTLFLKLAITFVMTPILVSNLGRYDYGLWEMVIAVVGYMGILDMGIRPTVSRYAAMAVARDDERELSQIYATAWFYLLVVGCVLALALTYWGLMYPATLAEAPQSDTSTYTLLLLILAAQLFLVFPAYTAESFMEAYQEYYLKNNITIINSIVGSAVIFYFIKPDNALLLLAGVNALGITSKYLFYVAYMQRKRRFLRPSPKQFSWTKLRELFRFSLKTLVQGLSSRVENSTDTLVIGLILGPATVPLYSIPANLVNYIRSISSNLTHVFMPYFSGLAARSETRKTLEVYFVGSKLTLCAVSVMAIGVLVLGQSFLELWIGGDIADGAGPIIWILVAFTCLPLLNPYSFRYLTAINRHGVYAKWAPLAAAANLGISLILINPLGIYGVALGSLLPGLVFQPFILTVCCRHLGITVGSYVRSVILPCLLPSGVMLGVIVLLSSYVEIVGYLELLAVAGLATVCFCCAALLTALSAGERRQLFGVLRRS